MNDLKEDLKDFKEIAKDKFIILYGKAKKKRKIKKAIKKNTKKLTKDILKIAL